VNFSRPSRKYVAETRMPDDEVLTEQQQFDRLYETHGSRLRTFFRFALGNASAADDLTQETFLDLWSRGPIHLDPDRGGFPAYLLGVARKKAAEWWRRNASRAPNPASEPVSAQNRDLLIQNALNQLPHDLRALLWMREVEGYSYDELKDIFQIPVGTVRSRLHNARHQIRTIWNQEAP
jgi:RNA polymerase sigma-70 factor, ECF subfamily